MIRQATIEEKEYYENRLYPLMDKVLAIMDSEKFYLTGGTCLARYYYNHRYSDDLDFFFLGKQFDKSIYESEVYKIVDSLDMEKQIAVNGEYFKRIIVQEKGVKLKLEFIYEMLPRIGEPQKVDNVWIDTKENVAPNKLTAIYSRNTYKDYYDLFFLLREIDFINALKDSESKMVPLDYEGALMSLKGELQERVLTINEFDEVAYYQFIKDLQKKLLSYAKDSQRLF